MANYFGVTTDYLLGRNDCSDDDPKSLDLKDAMKNDYIVVSWDGKRILAEELEIIRRILDGRKEDN